MVHEHNTTGVGSSKFGMSHDDVMRLVEKLDVTPEVNLTGLHCHIGSTVENLDMYRFIHEVTFTVYRKLLNRVVRIFTEKCCKK